MAAMLPQLSRFARCQALLGLVLFFSTTSQGKDQFSLKPGDVVAFTGGQTVVEWQENGYLELLLSLQWVEERPLFRNLGWEGDTVYAQPRDVNFPSTALLLDRFKASLVFLQFGQGESLEGPQALPRFVAAYESLLDQFSAPGRRLILISPTPFETLAPPMPDLGSRNGILEIYARAIQSLAARRGLLFVDLFTPMKAVIESEGGLTRNGIHLTGPAHWRAALELAGQLGFDPLPNIRLNPRGGTLDPPEIESLRQLIIEKNRFCFDYWRPMNWAFLHGDRVEQPSSRDHHDLSIRWFPQEMETFIPLIQEKENQIHQLSAELTRLFSR
jgi:hypothetical protein